MGTARDNREVDATSLHGLAHPLRVQLIEQLSQYGPATATQLAQRLHESSGATSYHLRQLERYGFVETDPDLGNGRERWWRRVAGRISIHSADLTDSTAMREAATLVLNEFHRGRAGRIDHWMTTADEWPRAWHDASDQVTTSLRLTAAELAELASELTAVVEAWKLRTSDRSLGGDVRSVEAQTAVFPLPDPDGTIPSG